MIKQALPNPSKPQQIIDNAGFVVIKAFSSVKVMGEVSGMLRNIKRNPTSCSKEPRTRIGFQPHNCTVPRINDIIRDAVNKFG